MVEAMGGGQRVGVERQAGRGSKGHRQGAEFLSCWEGAAETLWMPGAPQSLQSPTLPVETKLGGPTNHIRMPKRKRSPSEVSNPASN